MPNYSSSILKNKFEKESARKAKDISATEHFNKNLKNSPSTFSLTHFQLGLVPPLLSVVGVASPGLNCLAAPVWDAADQPSQFVLFQPVPFFLNSPGELIQVVCSWLSGIDGLQACSITFMSGDLAGHSSVMMLLACLYAVTILARWLVALSSTRMKFSSGWAC